MILRPMEVALHLARPHWQRRLLAILPPATLAVLLATTAALIACLGVDPSELLRRLAARLLDQRPLDLALQGLILLLALGHLLYLTCSLRREALVLADGAIEYRSPLGGVLNRLWPDWRLPIAEIRVARLIQPSWLRLSAEPVLELRAGLQRRRLRPLRWADPQRIERRGLLRLARSVRRQRTWLREHDAVLAYLRGAGLRIEGEIAKPAADKAGFDLGSHPAAIAAVAMLALLGGYLVVDLVANRETYVEPPPWGLIIVFGVLAGIAALRALWRTRLPRKEAAGLALLIGAVAAGAGYPLALRVNQAGSVAEWHEYRRTEGLRFEPLRAGPPVLRFERDADFWLHFPADTVHRFRLRYGSLGFYQLDREPIWQEIRRFNTARRAQERATR